MRATLRTALTTALSWAALWAVLTLLVGSALWILRPADIDPGEEPYRLAPVVAVAGFLCGLGYAALVGVLEARPRLRLSALAKVACGMGVAAMVPVVLGQGLPEMLVVGAVGAISVLALPKPRAVPLPT